MVEDANKTTSIEVGGGWDPELDAEIAMHLDMDVAARILDGQDPNEARLSALKAFGNVDLVRDVTAVSRSGVWLLRLLRDFQYALRRIERNVHLSVAVVSILALGMVAPVSMALILLQAVRPVTGIGNADRVLRIEIKNHENVPFSQVPLISAALRELSPLALSTDDRHIFVLQGRGRAVQVSGPRVSINFFALLEVHPALGHDFGARDGSLKEVILSDEVWRTSFDGDPAIVGSSVTVDGLPYTVAGVMAKGFRFPLRADETGIWIQNLEPELSPSKPLLVFARFANKNNIRRVKQKLSSLPGQIEAQGVNTTVVPAEIKKGIAGLFVGTLVFWLASCATASCLFLARCRASQKEIAIRQILGASKARIRTQLWIELMLFSSLGSIVGLFLVAGVLRLTTPLLEGILYSTRPSDSFWAFISIGLAFAAATAILFALPSALDSVRERSPGIEYGGGRPGSSFKKWILVTQIALSTSILSASGLLASAVYATQHSPLWFTPNNVLLSSFKILRSADGSTLNATASLKGLESRLLAIPGVSAVAFVSRAPFTRSFDISLSYDEGIGRPSIKSDRIVHLRAFTASAQSVFSFKLLAGRYFDQSDTVESPLQVVVNRAFVDQKFGKQTSPETALGEPVLYDYGNRIGRITGVIEDVPYDSKEHGAEPEVDVCMSQIGLGSRYYNAIFGFSTTVAVKLNRTGPDTIAAIQNAIAAQPPGFERISSAMLTSLIERSFRDKRLASYFSILLAIATLVLCAAALYGQFGFLLLLERSELGLRLALGAPLRTITSLPFHEAFPMVSLGLLLGNVPVFALAQFQGGFFDDSGVARYTAPLIASIIVAATCFLSATEPYKRLRKLDVARIMSGL